MCVDVHRRTSREQRALARSAPSSIQESPELPASGFWVAVQNLPRLQRSVVALHYVDDLSVAEAARVLGVSTGSVKTSLSRARMNLAATLQVHLIRKDDS